MSIITRIYQANCVHEYAIETIEYNTLEILCTAIDHRIICKGCGKEIVPKEQYQNLLELFGGR